MIIHQQPRTSRDLMMSLLSSETIEDRIELITSKTSVTLSWKENCIHTDTPLSELNPSLIQQSTHLSSDMNTVTDRGMKDRSLSSTAIDSSSSDLGTTAVTVGELAEWLRQNKDTEQEEGITSETNFDIMSEYSSADLLGIWFKTADSATQKV